MVGIAITLALACCGFMQWLRSARILRPLLVLTGSLALMATILRTPGNTRLNCWDGLMGPFIYTALFALARFLYKRSTGREPAYYLFAWYDPEEGRSQDLGDLVVHVVPMFAGIVVPLMLTRILG